MSKKRKYKSRRQLYAEVKELKKMVIHYQNIWIDTVIELHQIQDEFGLNPDPENNLPF